MSTETQTREVEVESARYRILRSGVVQEKVDESTRVWANVRAQAGNLALVRAIRRIAELEEERERDKELRRLLSQWAEADRVYRTAGEGHNSLMDAELALLNAARGIKP